MDEQNVRRGVERAAGGRSHLLGESHQDLSEEELQTNGKNGKKSERYDERIRPKKGSFERVTRHLAQPPQQEAHADAGRSGEVELVAQGRGEHKIIHVWGDRVEHRRGVVGCSASFVCLHLSTSDGEVPGVRHLPVASAPVLLRRTCGQNNN